MSLYLIVETVISIMSLSLKCIERHLCITYLCKKQRNSIITFKSVRECQFGMNKIKSLVSLILDDQRYLLQLLVLMLWLIGI